MQGREGDGSFIIRCIKRVQRDMILTALFSHILLYIAAVCLLCFVLQAVSLFVSLPWLHVYICVICVVCAAVVLFLMCRKLPTGKDAALLIDSKGLEERCVTALEFLNDESNIAALQAADTALALKRIEKNGKIRAVRSPGIRRIAISTALLAAALIISFIPSPARLRAKEHEELSLKKKEDRKEIEKVNDSLEEILKSDQLTEEEKRQIQDMLSGLSEMTQSLSAAQTMDALKREESVLDHEYAQMSKHLAGLAAGREGDVSKMLNDSADMLAESGTDSTENGASDEKSQNYDDMTSDAGSSQDGSYDGEGKEPGKEKNTDGVEDPETDTGVDGNGQGNGSGTGETDADMQGEKGEKNGDAIGGTGSGSGNGSQSAEGNGAGGDGEGNGNKGNDGSGEGSGKGQSDFGSGNREHDYVSIMNETGDDENLTGNRVSDGDTDVYRRQNGLSWEGEHVDASAVIGDYRQRAYEGIENGEYPEGMESVIKNYFDGFE